MRAELFLQRPDISHAPLVLTPCFCCRSRCMINENISPNNYSQKSSSYYYARKNSYDLLGASRDMKLLSDLRPKGKATKIYIYRAAAIITSEPDASKTSQASALFSLTALSKLSCAPLSLSAGRLESNITTFCLLSLSLSPSSAALWTRSTVQREK